MTFSNILDFKSKIVKISETIELNGQSFSSCQINECEITKDYIDTLLYFEGRSSKGSIYTYKLGLHLINRYADIISLNSGIEREFILSKLNVERNLLINKNKIYNYTDKYFLSIIKDGLIIFIKDTYYMINFEKIKL